MVSEFHDFIIWHNAYEKSSEIIKNIEQKFSLREVYEITWSKEFFSNNMTRFYGTNLPPGSFKEIHCGIGSFLLCLVEDKNPIHELRETTKGKRIVNVNTFDAKEMYRSWTGGGHKVHATDTEEESLHDLMLLLGRNLDDLKNNLPFKWDTKIKKINSNLMGYNGWKDLTIFFNVLNVTLKYVVLRNFENLPDKYKSKQHSDIDLLTNQFEQMQFVTNATKVFSEENRVLHTVKIANEDVLFDFRYVGDNYYDKKWSEAILDNRILSSRGFYIPNLENHFFSLLYHALIHKPKITDDYAERFIHLAPKLKLDNIDKQTFSTYVIPFEILHEYITKMKYNFTRPIDPSVFYNTEVIDFPKGFDTTSKNTVNEIYKEILHRTVDKEGLEYYASLLESKKMAIDDIRKTLLNSNEYKSMRH